MVSMPDAHPASPLLHGRHRSHAALAIPAQSHLGEDRGADQGEEIPMPAFNPQPSVRPSDRGFTMPPQRDLRPDLAAFFVKASREPAPRRIGNELGVLAELRAQGGYT
jgi:hypothetical protein